VSNRLESMESVEKRWKPRSIWAWLLAMVAGLLALITALLAYCMAVPVAFDSLGGFPATYALLFPLHLLLFTVVAALIAYITWRSPARLAAWVFSPSAQRAVIGVNRGPAPVGPILVAFQEAITAMPETVSCHLVAGDIDYLLEVVVPDLDHYQRYLVDKLLNLPIVREVRSNIVLQPLKAGAPLPLRHFSDVRSR
jgi:DNA-binding Lrp family transcriptional regulator